MNPSTLGILKCNGRAEFETVMLLMWEVYENNKGR